MTRCGCCGSPDLLRIARVVAWGRVATVTVCRACDLAPADVQAPLHDRRELWTWCARCGHRPATRGSDRCQFHGGARQGRG